MALIREQDYFFLTDTEYGLLEAAAENNPPPDDIFDTVLAAFRLGGTVVIDGHTYYYTLASNLNLNPLDENDLYEAGITLDYQVFRSMATLHPSPVA